MITPEAPPTTPEEHSKKCQRIINEIFGEDNSGDRKREVGDPVSIPLTELQATTAKDNEETLEQKIERIDETPLVEAPAKPKIQGFNMNPKVLGTRRRRSQEKPMYLQFSSDKHHHGRRRGTSRRVGSFDELAKRCLDAPSSHIDERLLKEMEKLGVPPTHRKGSRKTTNDAGIIQPDIMKRPRRPVQKTELDFLTMRSAKNYERLNADLPPPFELTPTQAHCMDLNLIINTENDSLCVERLPLIKDQIIAMNEDIEINDTNSVLGGDQYVAQVENRPPQQLLGQMTATVMSEGSDMITDKRNEVEHLVVRQQQLKSGPSDAEGLSQKDHDSDKISLAQIRELEEQDKMFPPEKLASTHLLSELVDPKEISPEAHSAGILREYKEIQMLRNLLRTRIEYLTQERVKRLYPKDKEEAFVASKETAPEVDRVVLKEFTESEIDDTLQQLGVNNLKMERVDPHHLKKDLNVTSNEIPGSTEPSIVIRECTDAKPLQEVGHTLLKSYSQKDKMVTPHKLFEELSIISRETEVGVMMEDLYEIEKDPLTTQSVGKNDIPPKSSTPGQFIENIGIVSQGSPQPKTGATDPQDLLKAEDSENEGKLSAFDTLHMLPPCSEARPLIEDETEEPVLTEDMCRIPFPNQLHLTDNRFVSENTDAFLLTKEDMTEAQKTAEAVTPQTVLNPLLDRSTVAHLASQKLNQTVSENTGAPVEVNPVEMHPVNLPNEHATAKPIPLSEMLKRVRERNRMLFCQQFEVRIAPEVDPLVGKCGKKQPPCPPPAPTCPPPPPKPCPPTKPPCPNPCKPKCPPTCPPTECDPKPKCPSPKKSPCEKFQKAKCSNIKIQDALTLLLYLGPQFHVPQKCLLPLLASTVYHTNIEATKTDVLERLLISLHNLCSLVLVAIARNDGAVEPAISGKALASKTYDPWAPIPSWPYPVREEKKKLVCPQEGCKVSPPKLKPSCRDPCLNPCQGFPKKHFSIIDLLSIALREKVVYDIGEF